MDCLLCYKVFTREVEFGNYNPDPHVCKKAISKLFRISGNPEVQGLSEELTVCLGCHLKLEEIEGWLEELEELQKRVEVGDLVSQFEELQLKIEEARTEIKQELTNSKDACEILAILSDLDLSQTSLDRLVLLKAIELETGNTRPPTPAHAQIDPGDSESSEGEQDQTTEVSESEDSIVSTSGVDGVHPAGDSILKKVKICPERAQIPRGSSLVKKQVIPNRVPSNSNERFALRNPKTTSKTSTQFEESSDEESSSDSESGGGSSSEDDTAAEIKSKSRISPKGPGIKRKGSGNARRARGSIIKEFTRLDNGSFQCKNCSRIITKNGLGQHLLIHAPRKFKCSVQNCGKLFTYKRDLDRHVKTVHQRRRDFSCTWEGCGKGFGEKKDLIIHVKNVHEGRRDFKCQVEGCDHAAGKKGDLNKHMSAKHKKIPIATRNIRLPTSDQDQIDARVSESANVEQNQVTDDSESEDSIDLASGVDGVHPAGAPMPKMAKISPKRAQIPRGSSTVKKQAKSNCVPSTSKAGYALRNQKPPPKVSNQVEGSSDEESGSESEPDENSSKADNDGRRARGFIIKEFKRLKNGSFQCKNCSKILSTNSSLRTHYLTHRPPSFKCTFQGCGDTFTFKLNRDRHMKTVHERKRDFICTWPGCGKSFGHKTHRDKHMRNIHEGRRDFSCTWPGCGKLFGEKGSMRTHVKMVHERRRDYKCGVEGCDKAFGTKSNLKQHMSAKHYNNPAPSLALFCRNCYVFDLTWLL